MTEPELVSEVNGWRLIRWSYDGAPLQAITPKTKWDGPWSVEIDEDGDLVFDQLPYEGARPLIPSAVLALLVQDALVRGVLKLERSEP